MFSRSPSSRRRSRPVLHVESLEDRRQMAVVNFAVDPGVDVREISPFIYGVNESLEGNYANAAFTRLGGNRWTAYNWENNASNAGADWLFQNDGYLGGGDVPGGAVAPRLQNAAARNAGTLLTIPINGYVSADKNGGGDVRNSGANYLQTRFKQEVAAKGAAFTLTPSTADAYVYQDEFVNWVNTNYPHGQTDPDRPIWYSLDNEPDLWAETHPEVHPGKTTYSELIAKTVAYADAIKDVAPGSKVFGPVNYGWNGFTTLQDAPDAGGRDFHTYYLQQLAQAETTHGKRLVDALDVHWYPEASGGGVRITEQNNASATVAARLQAPRSLWDPTYTETSWITQWSTRGPINLLPRLRDKIALNYPGTAIAVTEYNYGGGNHISGGLAQADVLGVFGREGVLAANQWQLAADESFIEAGFRMFRNYDGVNGSFGDTSVRATTDDIAGTSIYAAVDSVDSNVLTIVAINKTEAPITASLRLGQVLPGASVAAYQLTAAAAAPQAVGTMTVVDPLNFGYALPAYSVTTLKVVGLQRLNAAPTVAVPASANPVSGMTSVLNVQGDDDGGEAGLTYTWSTVGTPPAPVVFSANGTNAAKSVTATFAKAGVYSFRVTISDGLRSVTSDAEVNMAAVLSSVAVSPATVTVKTGATQAFSGVARDQFGVALATQPVLIWTVASGGGAVSASGIYTAPAVAGTATVRAAVGSVFGTATVSIVTSPPVAPASLAVKIVSSSRLDLAWTDRATNEEGFLVERSLDGVQFTQVAVLGINARSYSSTGLSANTRYYFRVRAFNAAGNSAYSNVANARTRVR